MKRARLTAAGALALFLLLVPTSALANKQVFTAVLRTAQGVQKGSALLGSSPTAGTVRVGLSAHSLSGPATTAHIQSTLDGSILVTLCDSSSPTPGVPLCTAGTGGPNTLWLDTLITPAMMHVSGAMLSTLISNGNAFINVRTELYPAGEVSGVLLPR